MTRDEILDLVRTRCDKTRKKGWTLQHDVECHPDGDLARLAVAFIERDSTKDPFGYPISQWTEWQKEPYITTLISAVALLVQEVERLTQSP